MPTNRTPAQWADLLAREVMGWTWHHGAWYVPHASRRIHGPDWSPWDNLTDAREVLERLLEIRSEEEFHIHHWPGASEVTIGDDTYGCGGISAASPGPHEGPAICLLAEEGMKEL